MLLSNKRALIYGGGGAIGGAVARVFAREGAELFLAGRTVAKLDAVASAIADAGFRGAVHTAHVDALDPVSAFFLTSRAAARVMRRQPSGGVILAFGGAADPPRGFYLGSLQTAFYAVEAMRRQLSVELGPEGVRVVTLKTGGVPESMPESMGVGRLAIAGSIVDATLLGRAATLEDVGNAAAFAASDLARTVTAATVNISCGTFMD